MLSGKFLDLLGLVVRIHGDENDAGLDHKDVVGPTLNIKTDTGAAFLDIIDEEINDLAFPDRLMKLQLAELERHH